MSKNLFQAGERNSNWKGGRTVTEHGYVLVKMPGHPLADVRGYVYEHRLVAEAKAGRPLRKGEVAHHRNEIKADNTPTNIELCASTWEHRAKHRKLGCRALRNPGESNPIIQCECGCGRSFEKFDGAGRPRRFISGHNPAHAATTQDLIIETLRNGPATRQILAKTVGTSTGAIACALSHLRKAGKAQPVSPGTWALQIREWPVRQ